MTETHDDDTDARIVIDFEDAAELHLETVDVGVADGVISFDVSGTISNVDDQRLDDLAGATLSPAEIQFRVAEPS